MNPEVKKTPAKAARNTQIDFSSWAAQTAQTEKNDVLISDQLCIKLGVQHAIFCSPLLHVVHCKYIQRELGHT